MNIENANLPKHPGLFLIAILLLGLLIKQDGAILLLTMFDHNTFGSDDFSGICVVSCNTTPLEGDECKLEHLNLFRYENSLAFNELEMRITEPMPHKFMKSVKIFKRETNVGHSFNSVLIFIGTTCNNCLYLCNFFSKIFKVLHEVNLEQDTRIITVLSQLVRKICKIDWSLWLLLEY